MILELAGAYFLVLIILFVLAEYSDKVVLGLFASAMLFPLAAWLLGSGLQIQTGQTFTLTLNNTYSETADATAGNLTITNGTITGPALANSTNVYQDIPETPYVSFSGTLGLLSMLFGLYGIFHYALKTMENK